MKRLVTRFPDDVGAELDRLIPNGGKNAFIVKAVREILLLEDERQAEHRQAEFQRQIENHRPIAESIVDGLLKASNVDLGMWLVAHGDADGALIKAVLMVADERGWPEAQGEK